MKGKEILLLCGTEEKQEWLLSLFIRGKTHKFSGFFRLKNEKNTYKRKIRHSDWHWVKRNLPNLVGVFQNHHDWSHGGVLYLLTKKQHQLLHQKERAGRPGEI